MKRATFAFRTASGAVMGAALLLVVAGALWVYAAGFGWLGSDEVDGEMTQTPRASELTASRAMADGPFVATFVAPVPTSVT